MRKLKKTFAAAFSAAVLSLPTSAFAALPPIMTTGEIARGDVGEAYTMIDDRGLQSFRVDVVGVIDTGKGAQPVIMAKASGELIDSVGGVLQGMSGSPVYIDGKLVGAVAAGIKDMTPSTFFITPIEDMLKLWDMPDEKNKNTFHTVDIKKLNAENKEWKEKFFKKDKKDDKEKNNEDNETAKTDDEKSDSETESETEAETAAESERSDAATETESVSILTDDETPSVNKSVFIKNNSPASFYFAGFDETGRAFVEKGLTDIFGESMLFNTAAANGESGTVYDAYIEPGSQMGIALVYGDFSVGATGTVTAVDGKKIVGFGHPFLHKGNVNYFLTDASVVGTMSGPTAGLKLATIGNIIGRISQDRAAGIAGELGTFPTALPVKIHVKDNVLDHEDSYGVRIAYDEAFLAQLSASIAYAAMSKTTDSLDGSTARVSFSIRTDAAENGKLERSNMFYSAADVGQLAVTELAQAVGIICANTDRESDIIDVQVDISLDGGRKTASLISAVPDKTKVKAGDTVNFTTVIKPYRKDKETLIIPYTVPKKQRSGNLNLDIRGGGLSPLTQLAALQQVGIDLSPQEDKTLSTNAKIKNFLETGRNNDIIIAPTIAPQDNGQKKSSHLKRDVSANKNTKPREIKLLADKAKKEGETKFGTDYIIDNVIHATLQITG